MCTLKNEHVPPNGNTRGYMYPQTEIWVACWQVITHVFYALTVAGSGGSCFEHSSSEWPRSVTGLPLGGRTPYITSWNRQRTPKLNIKGVPRTSNFSSVRLILNTETSQLWKKAPPIFMDYVIIVPPTCWKITDLVSDHSRTSHLADFRVLLTASVTWRLAPFDQ